MKFEERQRVRKFKRRQHQKRNAKLMRKFGGYNSFGWRTFVDGIKARIIRKIQLIKARKEAKTSAANG